MKKLLICIMCVVLTGNIYPEKKNTISRWGNTILKRIDANLMPRSYESYRKLINIEPNGRKKEYIFYTVRKGHDKIAMLYLSPASERDRATLRLGENMWLYIQSVGKPIRITSLQSVIGGVFNNADIMLLEYHVEYNVVKLKQTATHYILDLKAKNKTVAYDKLKMWVRKKGLLLRKVDCYATTGMLLKTLEFKRVRWLGRGVRRPSVVETYSPLYKGYKSIMIFTRVRNRRFANEVFTLNYLSRLGGLR